MKTLREIKNELAKEGYNCTFMQAVTFLDKTALAIFMDNAAKRYAEEALREAASKCIEDGNPMSAKYHIINLIKELK